ncbi:hydrogenase expression/formation protein HypE [Legionella sainthelensi]|uniref:hydrogenase expression/formation protein HypE n=1 Tax=Legionella sainthelensi TaxID=28087 RepID=UPI000F71B79B|nr:hydrogenase expression/formation protein HypE [Legionella sainthelensi]VEB37348.1 hydrogenase expression/formation protein HypE [Legionella sainthelensi]
MTVEAIRTPKIKVPKLDFKEGLINLTHGSGGRATAQLIDQLFLAAFDNRWLAQKNDQACFSVSSGKMVMTTDAHVISPLFFPGGNIGSLAVHGTINDIAMAGATPLYLSASFILEEGFPLADLKKIVESMACAARDAKIAIITGDTKVVERGKGDGVFITTTGIGVIPEGIHISSDCAKPGDCVLISGYIGDHGVAIMAHRNHLSFQTQIESDSASLHGLVSCMLNAVPNIHCLRDPTRGGLATTLNEFASQSNIGFIIDEHKIPIRTEVASACELLGLDALYVANEGKLVALCPPQEADTLLTTMRSHPLGIHAEIIGEVIEDPRNLVQLKTKLGGTRIVDWLVGEQLPRIC